MTQRPEIDPERIAVGGASYGGVFSTLLAGIDPRLKAGVSYFGGGNHALGTNLPQFTKMKSLAEVEIWNKTIDPAFRHKTRSIPFLWAVAFNDNWFYFPAVTQTFKDAINTDKRMVIMPRWRHGFPENIDKEIADFLDTTLTKTRPAYNAPGALELIRQDGHPIFRFNWTGKNPVKKAELIVSYGEYTPWYGWLHRASFNFPAQINGSSASAPLPIPSLNLPLVAWGNITDTQDVVTSTEPVVLTAKDLVGFTPEPSLKLNCFVDEDFGPAAIQFYERTGEPLAGTPDLQDKQSGLQSMRVDAVKEGEPLPVFKIGLFHNVTGLAHKLSVWLKADKAAKMSISLTPIRPPNWSSAAVAELVAKDPRLSPLLPLWKEKPTPISVSSEVGTEWKEVILDVPQPTAPVEGYKLEIRAEDNSIKTYWVDSLRMAPIWP